MVDHAQVLSQARAAVRARGGIEPVPELRVSNPLWLRAQLTLLRKVVGPLRRRRHRDPLPLPLSGEETARRLFALPVSYWSYDWEPGVRHLGPMSQDFSATFGLGTFTRRIDMVDANGVAVVAIQSLHRTVTGLEREVEALRARVAQVESVHDRTGAESSSRQTDIPVPHTMDMSGIAPGAHREAITMNENSGQQPESDVAAHRFYSSDQTIKDDIEPVTWADGEDLEAHRFHNSDQTIKDDIEPVTWPDGEDLEAHRFYNSDQTIKDDIEPVTWPDGEDVEAHRSYSSSDQTIKDDIESVTWESDLDTEAHRFSSSDQTIKDDIEPVTWADGDDVEGHKIYSGSDQTIKDDIEPVTWEGDDTSARGL